MTKLTDQVFGVFESTKGMTRMEYLVFAALADLKWDLRTVGGISRETRIPEEEVRIILEAHPRLVRKSLFVDKRGTLYALRSRPTTWRERLAVLRQMITMEVS